MFEDMKTSLLTVAGAITLCVSLALPAPTQAANFQVAVKRLSVTQCSLTGSMLNIDPATGNISIDLASDFGCYPLVVSSIATNASLTVTGPFVVGGGTTGQGSVTLQLNTGLSGVTPGVTCVPDGISSSNVTVSSGWSTTLCTNCGASATRTVSVQNTSSTLDGNVIFKAKCTYQDQTNANLSSTRENIQSTPTVTVQHGSAPPANFCQSVSELANPNGLTPAMRQTVGTVTGGSMPGTNISWLEYTSIFGVSANTFPPGDPDPTGYGFPGVNRTNVTFGLNRGKYMSLKFRAPSNPIWNNITGAFQTIPGGSFTLVAIGSCPGQFATDPNFPAMNSSCRVAGKSQDLPFKITAAVENAACKLEPGKFYYLNMIQAAGFSNLTTPSCASTTCTPKINILGAAQP